MSKYNIDDIVLRPIMDYVYTKSKLDSPNIFYVLLNKLNNNNKIIDELNSISEIKYMAMGYDDCIVFKPKFCKQIMRKKTQSKNTFTNNQ